MLTTLALLFAAQAQPAPAAPAADPVFAKMAQLYEDICLTPFPDDDAVAAAMATQHATELRKEEVRIYLHDDPGRGWTVGDGRDGKFVVTIEAPPYHACAIRHAFAAPVADRSAYQDVAARYKSIGPSFKPMHALDMDQAGGVKSHIDGDGRVTNLGTEILMVVTDSRPDGSVEMRFVRQIRK